MSVLKINLSAREDNEICTSRFSKEIGAKFFMTSGLMSFDSVLLLKMAFLIGFSSPNPLKTELYLINKKVPKELRNKAQNWTLYILLRLKRH